jgi:hypothetical protein
VIQLRFAQVFGEDPGVESLRELLVKHRAEAGGGWPLRVVCSDGARSLEIMRALDPRDRADVYIVVPHPGSEWFYSDLPHIR